MSGTSEGARKGHTPESDAKRRETMQRKWADPTFRAKQAAAEATPERKARRSAAMQEVNNRPEKRAKHSVLMTELHQDPEFKIRHADGMRQANQERPEINDARSTTMQSRWTDSPELFAGSVEALRQDARSPEGRARRKQTFRKTWKTNEKLVENLNATRANRAPTNLELAVGYELTKRGVIYIPRYFFARHELDLYVPALKLDVEADGRYWHDGKAFPWRPDWDAERDARLAKHGIRVLRLTEAEITGGDWSRLDEALG